MVQKRLTLPATVVSQLLPAHDGSRQDPTTSSLFIQVANLQATRLLSTLQQPLARIHKDLVGLWLLALPRPVITSLTLVCATPSIPRILPVIEIETSRRLITIISIIFIPLHTSQHAATSFLN